jgi:hypothetical protein
MAEESAPAAARGTPGAARALALDWAIALASVLPLLLTAHLPLTDLPNHLARQYILRDLASSPVLQQFYEVRWALIPNLAMDIFVTGARVLMPIDFAVRLFCIVTMLLLFFGTRAVNLALGGAECRFYRFTPLILYGGPFQFGFLNYCFSVGLALVLFGLYLRLRARPWPVLVLVFAPLSLLLLVCHLFGFGYFALAAGGFELAATWTEQRGWSQAFLRRLAARGAVILLFLAPALILYKLFSPMAATELAVHYQGLQGKIDGLAAVFLFSSPATELPLLLASGLCALAALYTRTARFHPAFYVLAFLFALLFLVTPRSIQGGTYTDYRIPWGASFFLLACLVPGAGAPYRKPLALTAGVLAAIRVGLIAWFWIGWEPVNAAIDTALSHLPVGTRLMTVWGDTGSVTGARRPPLTHAGGYLVARRQGFESNIFADMSGQILFLRKPYGDIRTPDMVSAVDSLAPEYDYILVINPQAARIAPDLKLSCVAQGRFFRLFRVVAVPSPQPPQGACGA